MLFTVKQLNLRKHEHLIDDSWPDHPFQTSDVLSAINTPFYLIKNRRGIELHIVYLDETPVCIAPVRPIKSDALYVAGSHESFDYTDFIYNPVFSLETKEAAFYQLMDYWKKQGFRKLIWNFLDGDSISYQFAQAHTMKTPPTHSSEHLRLYQMSGLPFQISMKITLAL